MGKRCKRVNVIVFNICDFLRKTVSSLSYEVMFPHSCVQIMRTRISVVSDYKAAYTQLNAIKRPFKSHGVCIIVKKYGN